MRMKYYKSNVFINNRVKWHLTYELNGVNKRDKIHLAHETFAFKNNGGMLSYKTYYMMLYMAAKTFSAD